MVKWKQVSLVLGLALICGHAAVFTIPLEAQDGENCAFTYEARTGALRDYCGSLAPDSLCTDGQAAVAMRQDGTPVPSGTWPLDGVATFITAGPGDSGQLAGISILRVPALEAGITLTAILFGDATLTNDPGEPQAPTCAARSIGTVNVRTEPTTEASVIGQLVVGQQVQAIGRLADSSWWRILWEGVPAWIFAELAPIDCDPGAMLIYDPVSGEVSGGIPAPDFQGAKLESSFAVPTCPGLPRAGLLLQNDGSPATWRVNGQQLRIDGTALIQASASDVLAIQVLEGVIEIQVNGIMRSAAAGQLLRVPQQGSVATGIPGPAVDYMAADIELAPLGLLPRQVVLPAATVPLPVSTASVVCDWLPQQVTVIPVAGRAILPISGEVGRSLRLSAGGNGLTELSFTGPDGAREQVQGGTALNLDVSISSMQPGSYSATAVTNTSEPVRFGVTCDLPQAAVPQRILDCGDVLLQWEGVTGGTVQLQAAANARISVIAERTLQNHTMASTLVALSGDGQRLGVTAFVSLGELEVAGPFAVDMPADGIYTLSWDGDPFAPVDVEVICMQSQVDSGGSD